MQRNGPLLTIAPRNCRGISKVNRLSNTVYKYLYRSESGALDVSTRVGHWYDRDGSSWLPGRKRVRARRQFVGIRDDGDDQLRMVGTYRRHFYPVRTTKCTLSDYIDVTTCIKIYVPSRRYSVLALLGHIEILNPQRLVVRMYVCTP